MAKELPYFKFEPSEWQNGDIQMMSPETQLAFLNICCTYWQRKCNLLYAFALQKHCDGNTQILDSLIDCNIIGLSDDNKLQISFLDSQIVEVESKSKSAKKSAEARWAKGSDANAMRTHTDRNAIREDKIREDKIKEEKVVEDKIDFIDFWELYDKKTGKPICENKWDKLPRSIERTRKYFLIAKAGRMK
jgi:hypothetical protein